MQSYTQIEKWILIKGYFKNAVKSYYFLIKFVVEYFNTRNNNHKHFISRLTRPALVTLISYLLEKQNIFLENFDV